MDDVPSTFVSASGLIYRREGEAKMIDGMVRMRMSCALWDKPALCGFNISEGIGNREVVDYSRMFISSSDGAVEIVSSS